MASSNVVWYSLSSFGSGDKKIGAPTIIITDSVAVLSVGQTGNIGSGTCIEYNSLKAYIVPNRILYINGSYEILTGDRLQDMTSGATGIVRAITTRGGVWSNGTAFGEIYFESIKGTWGENHFIRVVRPSSRAHEYCAITDSVLQGNLGFDNTQFVVLTSTGDNVSNQSEVSVTSIHHEYSSLSSAESGCTDSNHINSTNLVTKNVCVYLSCYYDDDDYTPDTYANVNIGTTDVDHFLFVYTPIGGCESINRQRHDGVWDGEKYYISNNGVGVTLGEDFTVFDGLQVTVSPTSSYTSAIEAYTCSNSIIKNCILRQTNVQNRCGGVYAVGSGTSGNVLCNSIIYGFSEVGIYAAGGSPAWLIYNNTFTKSYEGIKTSTNAVLSINNISYDNSVNDFVGTFYTGSDYNFSKDNSAPGVHSLFGSSQGKYPRFIDSFNDDYHILEDSDAIDRGIALPSFEWRSIGGSYRVGVWDIGADEYIRTSTTINQWHIKREPSLDNEEHTTEKKYIIYLDSSSVISLDCWGINNMILKDSTHIFIRKRG